MLHLATSVLALIFRLPEAFSIGIVSLRLGHDIMSHHVADEACIIVSIITSSRHAHQACRVLMSTDIQSHGMTKCQYHVC